MDFMRWLCNGIGSIVAGWIFYFISIFRLFHMFFLEETHRKKTMNFKCCAKMSLCLKRLPWKISNSLWYLICEKRKIKRANKKRRRCTDIANKQKGERERDKGGPYQNKYHGKGINCLLFAQSSGCQCVVECVPKTRMFRSFVQKNNFAEFRIVFRYFLLRLF